MNNLKDFISKLPKPWRYVFSALIAAALGIALAVSSSSCSTVKAISYGNGRLSTSVTQSVADSLNIVVHFNNR